MNKQHKQTLIHSSYFFATNPQSQPTEDVAIELARKN
jgi:hypothetical protein